MSDPLIGSVIAERYTITDTLGRGGMGAVYRAEQAHVERTVAIKLLRAELLGQSHAKARFLREAKVASRVVHPHVVAVHDFGYLDDGSAYLVMEYVQGETLNVLQRRVGALSWPRVARLGIQMARALSAAHAQGVVHRDVKPQNVMVCRAGSDDEYVKVLDFGIAKLLESTDAPELTGVGRLIGTPAYMAPEQIAGGAIGPHTDCYAFGAVMFKLLCGDTPFGAGGAETLMGKSLMVAAPRLDELLPRDACPDALAELIARCLAKLPGDRPPSMDAVAETLSGMLGTTDMSELSPEDTSERTTAAGSAGSGARMAAAAHTAEAPKASRSRAAVATGVLLTLLAVGGAIVWLSMRDQRAVPGLSLAPPLAPDRDGSAAPTPKPPVGSSVKESSPTTLSIRAADVRPTHRLRRAPAKAPPVAGNGVRIGAIGAARGLGRAASLDPSLCSAGSYRGAESCQDMPEPLRGKDLACWRSSSGDCLSVGWAFRDGDEGVPKNLGEAVVRWERACLLRSATGCTQAARRYGKGEGVTRDDDRARELYEAGCDLGSPYPCLDRGSMTHYGQGMAIDLPDALVWYEKGCRAGGRVECLRYAGLVRDPRLPQEERIKKAHWALARVCDEYVRMKVAVRAADGTWTGSGDRVCRETEELAAQLK